MIGRTRALSVCLIAVLSVWAATSSSHARRALHTRDPVIILKGRQGMVYFLAFSPDGQQIASGSDDGTVDVWDVRTSRLLRSFKASSRIFTIAFSPDGQKLATSSADRKINVWRLQGGELLSAFAVPGGPVYSMGYTTDGKWIAAACKDGVIRLYSTRGQLLYAVGDIVSGISVVNSPTGARVAAVDGQGLSMRDVETGELVLARKLDGYSSLPHFGLQIPLIGVSPNADFIAAVGSPGPGWAPPGFYSLIILDTASGKRVVHQVQLGLPHFSFSPDGKSIAVSSWSAISVIDIKTQRELHRFTFGKPYLTSLMFSPDGKRIASGYDDGTLRIWNAQRSRHAE
jgi:WD40 repeat protein